MVIVYCKMNYMMCADGFFKFNLESFNRKEVMNMLLLVTPYLDCPHLFYVSRKNMNDITGELSDFDVVDNSFLV